MPVCTKSNISKIPLLRYDKHKPYLYSAGGAHTFDTCGEHIPIAKNILNIHHFNYRRPENTIHRLNQLCQKRSDGTRRIDVDDYKAKKFSNSSDARSMYIDRLDYAMSIYNNNKYNILINDDLPYDYKNIVRWYDPYSINVSKCSSCDILLYQAIHYFSLRNYDLSLFKFYNLLEITNDKILMMIITIKISICLSLTDKKEALSLLKPILKCDDTQIRSYAIKQFHLISEDKLLLKDESARIEYDIQNYYDKFHKKDFL
jgi:hypothetical protein